MASWFCSTSSRQPNANCGYSPGLEPHGVAVSPDGRRAYVALASAGSVAVVDLDAMKEVTRIDVGRWPRSLALTPDGKRLAVGVSGDGGVAVVDTVRASNSISRISSA